MNYLLMMQHRWLFILVSEFGGALLAPKERSEFQRIEVSVMIKRENGDFRYYFAYKLIINYFID